MVNAEPDVTIQPDIKEICQNVKNNVPRPTKLIFVQEKYFHKDIYDSCKDCPLKVKQIHCVKGLVEEESNLLKKLSQVQELLKEGLQMEIEVEE